MAESSDTVWKQLSSCSVCDKEMDKNSSPQLLPCCHSSCIQCFNNNLNQLTTINTTNNSEKGDFKCKVCLQEYSPHDCIPNYFQQIYWSRNECNENSICQSCEEQNPAVIYCNECKWICEDCHKLHNTIKFLKGHQIDEKTKISVSKNMTNICPDHNEELTVYCKNCQKPYCCRCILKEHNLHVYEDTKDVNKLNQIYNDFKENVDKIKEKRSLSENTLQKFDTFEADITEQKKECIETIKSIVKKLEEKVSELGKTLLDKINTICQQKEKEFNEKKNQLRQINSSFVYMEQFMSTILTLNDPMSVMKSQDLLNSQLQRLLNKPCTHLKPFTIKVKDSLSNGEGLGNEFDVGKMIDGVINMCFKIETSDDPKINSNYNNAVNTINRNLVTIDDEISIIGITKPNNTSIRPSINPMVNSIHNTIQQNQQTRQPVRQIVRNTSPQNMTTNNALSSIIKGNHKELSAMLSNSSHQSNNYSNQMQSYPTYSPMNAYSPQIPQTSLYSEAPTTTLSNSLPINSTHLQSMHRMQNNFVPQTGLLSGQSYGTPVYRPINTNQSLPNQSMIALTVPTTQSYNNTVGPNVSLNSIQMTNPPSYQTYRIPNSGHILNVSTNPPLYVNTLNNTNVQSMGTTHPTVIYPATSQQSSTSSPLFNTPLTRSTNNYSNRQKTNTNQNESQNGSHQMRRSSKEQEQRDIQLIKQNLLKDIPPNLTISPLTQRSANTNPTNLTTLVSQSPPACDRGYTLHIPDAPVTQPMAQPIAPVTQPMAQPIAPMTQPMAQPIAPVTQQMAQPITQPMAPITPQPVTSEPQRRTSKDSMSQSSESRINTSVNISSLERVSTTNVLSTVQPSVTSVQKSSIDSNQTNQTTALSMPTLSNIIETTEKSTETNKDKSSTESENLIQTTTPTDSSEEIIVPNSNPPSVTSLFSELSNEASPQNIANGNTNTNNEENQENTSNSRTSAPVAIITPITNETESNDNLHEMIDEREEDSTDEEFIDDEADCVVCTKEYGEFICCSQCPRAFHCECHVPELKKMPETSFICTICKSLEEMAVSSRTRKSGLNDRQQRSCEKVLLHLLCHKKSNDFKPPFSENIQQNNSLITIKKKLDNKEYDNEITFIDDIKRLLSRNKNRNITPEVMEDYKVFERYFKKIVHKVMPAFSEALQTNTSINNSSGGSAPKKSKSNCISV